MRIDVDRPSRVLAGLFAAVTTACAGPDLRTDPHREGLRIEIALLEADGTRVIAPSVTCLPGQPAEVSVARPYSYIEDYEVEVGQDSFIAEPIVRTLHEGCWLDLTGDRTADGRVALRYEARHAALRRPVETFTTTLGAFTKPVTIEIPELRTSDAIGTCRLEPGVESPLVRFDVGDASSSLTVLARVTLVPMEESGAPAEPGLDH